MQAIPTLKNIIEAQKRIQPFAHKTPVLKNRQVDERCNAKVYLKCENFQKVGAFKFRGATNAVMSLSTEEARNGVVTHSSGNHGQALALAASIRNIPAYIVMPENAPQVKKDAVRGYGAKIVFCKPTLESREQTTQNVIEETDAKFIHPYDNSLIVAGQGTAALELLEAYQDLDIMIAPVGGGGLMSGTALVSHYFNEKIQIFGTEPVNANDAWLSFKNGLLFPVQSSTTIADGLRTSLSNFTYHIIRQYVDDIVTVSEHSIIEAMRFVWERMKIIVEPSSAVPLAALFEQKIKTQGLKIGVIISGGNVDFNHLPWQ